jgi:hypothetical protein
MPKVICQAILCSIYLQLTDRGKVPKMTLAGMLSLTGAEKRRRQGSNIAQKVTSGLKDGTITVRVGAQCEYFAQRSRQESKKL